MPLEWDDIEKVRIPELPPYGVDDDLTNLDRIAIWHEPTNKTRYKSLGDIATFINAGGGDVLPITVSGSSILYTVPEDVDLDEQDADIPLLAGKTFLLRREGKGALPLDRYEIKGTGGFRLLATGDYLQPGEVWELQLGTGAGTTPDTPSGGAMITGRLTVSSTTSLNATHIGKLIQIRAAGTAITLTLPSVADIPENSIIPIESNITNAKQPKIQTTGSQFIYFRDEAKTAWYMGVGETLWLISSPDGWYVIQSYGNWDRIGEVSAKYSVGKNEIQAAGQLLNRADHPRLWEYVQTLGSILVDEATWNLPSAFFLSRTVDYPNRGCYSTGDLSTNFRVPDLRNVALRGRTNGADAQRYRDGIGGFQRHEFEGHNHQPANDGNGTAYGFLGKSIAGAGITVGNIDGTGSGSEPNVVAPPKVPSTNGGSETRMDNVAILWVIKE